MTGEWRAGNVPDLQTIWKCAFVLRDRVCLRALSLGCLVSTLGPSLPVLSTRLTTRTVWWKQTNIVMEGALYPGSGMGWTMRSHQP